jgi:prepilin-type processing-associated H-X9-DG protein
MYANEWNGRFPPIAHNPHISGTEFFVINDHWNGGALIPDPLAIYPEYWTDINLARCPSDPEIGQMFDGDHPDDYVYNGEVQIDKLRGFSFEYIGFAVRGFGEGCVTLIGTLDAAMNDMDFIGIYKDGFDRDFEPFPPIIGACRSGDPDGTWPDPTTIYRLREGIERFYITDINNPAGSAIAQSEVVVMWDVIAQKWQPFNHIPGGGNILYMDGHVEFVKYPSDQWPFMEEFCTIR